MSQPSHYEPHLCPICRWCQCGCDDCHTRLTRDCLCDLCPDENPDHDHYECVVN